MLFPTCIPVKGEKTGILMDLDRASYTEIPNLLCEILNVDLKHNAINEVKTLFNNYYDNGIDEYFDFLVQKEYGFYTNNPSPFNKPENIFESPYKVISSVLAIDNKSTYNLKNTISQLVDLGCQLLQIRVYSLDSLHSILNALEPIKESRIRIVELYLPYSSDFEDQELIQLVKNYPNLILIIHSSPQNKQLNISKESIKKIAFVTNHITNSSEEVYAKELFTITHNMYYEANHFNTGLYRKVCVNEKGEIKNYLSHNKSFGNITDTQLENVITTDIFNKKGAITNDQIEKCNSCQYRYMCTSNSDIEERDKKFYKLNSCDFEL